MKSSTGCGWHRQGHHSCWRGRRPDERRLLLSNSKQRTSAWPENSRHTRNTSTKTSTRTTRRPLTLCSLTPPLARWLHHRHSLGDSTVCNNGLCRIAIRNIKHAFSIMWQIQNQLVCYTLLSRYRKHKSENRGCCCCFILLRINI